MVARTIVVDHERPSLVVTTPQGDTASTVGNRYTLRGTASDNITPIRLDIRRQPPGGSFGAWERFDLSGFKKNKSWSREVRLNARGAWRVQVRVVDAAGNVSAAGTIRIIRQ